MSKINRIRIINLNYNNNAIRIDDETFHLSGESTLFSLRNGGGKSVLVQILTAPFVHKRHCDTKDRPFSSYFTTNKPTFILVEWALDGGVGYVLTGMMVRKSQENDIEEMKDELEIVQFIHEYRNPNPYDLSDFPCIQTVMDGQNQVKKLLGFYTLKQLLENLKKDKTYRFDIFDMTVPSRARQYYEKLQEFQIYHKEWESIIKKVNLKESGLSELFMDAKDESGLTEKWFLDAVENKLNKEESKIKEFGRILQKYITQYKENASKIERRESIKVFREETDGILKKAQYLKNALHEKQELENKIANLITQLNQIKELKEQELQSIQVNMKELEEALKEILYEELSLNVYQLEEKQKDIEDALLQIEQDIINKNAERDKFEKKRHIQECAKLYKDYKETSKELQGIENELDIAKQKNQDLIPERNQLGYNLRCHYEKEVERKNASIKEMEEKVKELKEQQAKFKQTITEKEAKEREYYSKEGQMISQIKSYDEIEQSYNLRYQEAITRNIIGEYEEDVLSLAHINNEKLIKMKTQEVNQLKNVREENEKKLISSSRDIEDLQKEVGGLLAEITVKEKELESYEEKINTRKTLLQYINFREDRLFHTEAILNEYQTKIWELDKKRKIYEKECELLKDEYKKLESGKILELPDELVETLETEGIHYIYGMDWLKKNNKSPEENKELIDKNPFIPYGIIMSEHELLRLMKKEMSIFTSFPIPIIKRESLEVMNNNLDYGVVHSDKVSFYVVFNHNLLDEEGLKNLLEKKEKEINKVSELIHVKDEEIEFYIDKREQIKFQNISEKEYKSCQSKLKDCKERKTQCESNILSLRQSKNQIEESQKKTIEAITKESNIIQEHTRKQGDLEELISKYNIYLEKRKDLEQCKNFIAGIRNDIKTIKTQVEALEESIGDTKNIRHYLLSDLEKAENKKIFYSSYKDGTKMKKDIEDIEARFEAITKEITTEQQVLEEQLEKLKKRFLDTETELIYKSERYKLKETEYQNEVYDRSVDEELERAIFTKTQELEQVKDRKHQLSTEIEVIKTKVDNKMKELYEKVQKNEVMPRSRIITTEQTAFKKRKKEKEIQRLTETNRLQQVQLQLGFYQENLSNLAEYEQLQMKSEETFDIPLVEYDREGLNRLRGNLLRDYKQISQGMIEKNQDLYEVFHQVMSKEEFQDEFFKKSFETMSTLLKNPDILIEQLTMALSSYDNLMAKLDIDIAFVEEEKNRVMDMLLEYVEDVHRNLGKIDKNSTIKVRDKSIKMLRIKLPDWAEYESMYKTRLIDFIDDLTRSGLHRLDKNESIEELLGASLTTKNLYDTVVGISNVTIELYKIEEQREYKITWTDVSKNSGGEGFLSAFVILSSLLSFMRRDETDIFAEYEEGKVLIMDNPFAQTNAAHLLKPLMDIAKKTNTQLICLSGLGGESIYNRFDNIYVLNLITSDLRRGMQYLRGEHTKGEEKEQTLISARVKVEDVEQIELLF